MLAFFASPMVLSNTESPSIWTWSVYSILIVEARQNILIFWRILLRYTGGQSKFLVRQLSQDHPILSHLVQQPFQESLKTPKAVCLQNDIQPYQMNTFPVQPVSKNNWNGFKNPLAELIISSEESILQISHAEETALKLLQPSEVKPTPWPLRETVHITSDYDSLGFETGDRNARYHTNICPLSVLKLHK